MCRVTAEANETFEKKKKKKKELCGKTKFSKSAVRRDWTGSSVTRVHPLAEGLARVLKQYPPGSESNPRILHQRSVERHHSNTREREREEERQSNTYANTHERKPRRDYYGFACSECPRFRAECSREHCLRGGSFSFDGNGGKTMGRAASPRSLYYKR